MLCRSEAALQEEAKTVDLARSLGLGAEMLTPRQAAKLEPGMEMTIAGAAYFPQDCHLSPERFIDSLTKRVREIGAELHFGTEVIGARARDGRIESVETNRGSFSADEYVVAGGSPAPRLLPDLHLKLSIQTRKG